MNGSRKGTDPDRDSDRDLLKDDEEVFKYGTDPFDADTDADGVPDDTEVAEGGDPTDPTSVP